MRIPRPTFRRLRQGTLLITLLAVSIWGFLNWRAETFTFAWEKPVDVLVVPLIDPASPLDENYNAYFLHDFLSSTAAPGANLAGAVRWFQDEFRRHADRSFPVLDLTLRSPARVQEPPPLLPEDSASFLERWRGTSAFLGYFESLDESLDLLTSAHEVTIFLYFYSSERRSTFAEHHPVATRRKRWGIVFVPLDSQGYGFYAALLAHEICHTFGASDKYDGLVSAFPQGFAEPERVPLYPQEKAEIMALGIPVAPGREARVEGLTDCVVGTKTAEEMGWR